MSLTNEQACELDLRVMRAEMMWYRSSLVALLTLAEAKPSPLTNGQVVSICKVTLGKFNYEQDVNK